MLCVLLSFIFFITKSWGYYNKLSTLLMAFSGGKFWEFPQVTDFFDFQTYQINDRKVWRKLDGILSYVPKNIYCIVSAGNFSGFSSRKIYLTYTLVVIMLAKLLKDHTTAIYWFNLNNKQTLNYFFVYCNLIATFEILMYRNSWFFLGSSPPVHKHLFLGLI